MTRLSVSFLAGSALTCAAAIVGDTRLGVMFLAGVVFAALTLFAALASTGRARIAARFLVAVCDALDNRQKKPVRAQNAQGAPVSEGARPDTRVADLSSALQNFGMKRKQADIVAAQSVAAGGTFADQIRRATALN